MEKYEKIRLSDTFINLTSETVHTYDKTSGEIWKFPPQPHEIPALPAIPSRDEPIVHYIVDDELIPVIAAFRPLDDIVKIRREYRGRSSIKIVYFAWAKDEKTDVYLYKNAHHASFPHK